MERKEGPVVSGDRVIFPVPAALFAVRVNV